MKKIPSCVFALFAFLLLSPVTASAQTSPSSATNSGPLPPGGEVCLPALASGWLTGNEPQWERTVGYQGIVAEAMRRGYTPAYCAALLRGQRPSPSTPAPSENAATPTPDPLVVSVQTLWARSDMTWALPMVSLVQRQPPQLQRFSKGSARRQMAGRHKHCERACKQLSQNAFPVVQTLQNERALLRQKKVRSHIPGPAFLSAATSSLRTDM